MIHKRDDLFDRGLWVLENRLLNVKEPSGTVKAAAFFSTSALTAFDGKNPNVQTKQLTAWSELGELIAILIGRGLEYYVFDYETDHERIGVLRKFIHWLRTGEEQPN